LREAGRATQNGLPEHGPAKEPKIPQRTARRDGGPVQGRRPYTQPSRQPTAGGNAQKTGPSSRPRRARCCCAVYSPKRETGLALLPFRPEITRPFQTAQLPQSAPRTELRKTVRFRPLVGGIQVENLVAIFLLLCALWVIGDLNMPGLLFFFTIFGVYLV
jgi:hypothetical protein